MKNVIEYDRQIPISHSVGLETGMKPPKTIVVSDAQPVDTIHRAVHIIRSSALCHNYSEVESAANRQRCSVIVVVKADGYGHGAIATALFLADNMGADCFAVATVEEGIALRKAFQQTATKPAGVKEH